MAQAVRNSNASLVTGALIERLLVAPDGKRIDGVAYRQGGKRHELYAGMVAAGAVNSAALLLRPANDSCPDGVANHSGRRRPVLHEPQLHRAAVLAATGDRHR